MDSQIENAEEFLNPPFPPNQRISEFCIKSPLGQQHVTNTNFQQIQKIVLSEIEKIKQSDNFRGDKDITVKMGMNSDFDPLRRKHDFVLENVHEEIKQIQSVIYGYDNAKTATNQLLRFSRPRQSTLEFYPYILIQATRKKGLYAKMNQQFSDKGFASFGATLGYWNPFKLNDKIEVEYEGGVNQKVWKKFNFHNYSIKWMVPHNQGTLQLEGAYSFSWIAQGLYEGAYHFSPKLINKNFQVGLQIAKRSVLIDTKSQGDLGYFAKNYMEPSRKLSVKFNKDLTDSMDYTYQGIPNGQTSDIHIEATVPVLSQAQFVKLDYHFRRYFDLYTFGRNRTNQILKKALQNSSFEIATSVNATLKKTKFVSDYLRPLAMRGFETSDMPHQSPINIKTSLKWNIHNFPVLGRARIRTFLFYQAGLTFQRLNIFKLTPSIRSSAGWGFSFPLSPAAHLQIIYNLFQQQSNSRSRPTNFQVRIGFND